MTHNTLHILFVFRTTIAVLAVLALILVIPYWGAVHLRTSIYSLVSPLYRLHRICYLFSPPLGVPDLTSSFLGVLVG